ncbi:MAG TPA: hypothetical protein VNN76_07090, partial [Bacteroidota bacterium]|nr:hypothetical protein [Bacteroidota bacterium]
QNISYADAKAGRVVFAAVVKNPTTRATPIVRVSLQNDQTKKGEEAIVVIEQTLRIVVVGPRTVLPLVPPFTAERPHPENTTVLEVYLTRGGQPVANHGIRLTSDYEDGSGGHDHVSPRRPRSFENYGHFVSTRTNQRGNPITDVTGNDGRAAFGYIASQFGDRMKFRVESSEKPLLWDTTSILERVPDLVALGPGQQYELVGGPDNHSGTNDPCRDASSLKSLHFRNHYGTSALVQAIRNIAASYDSLNPGVRLRINDMSLEYGGLFDTGNRWKSGIDEGHAEHRIGENADIGFRGIDVANRCLKLKRERLLRAIEAHTHGRVRTHYDHYHIRVR